MAWVLFFDGDCGFCSRSVRAVFALDKKGTIEYAPLQGDLADRMGFSKFAEKGGGTMVMLRESDGKKFFKGDAWIVLGKELGGVWLMLARVFEMFPKVARDWCYDLIAKNRFAISEKIGSCETPSERLRARMRK